MSDDKDVNPPQERGAESQASAGGGAGQLQTSQTVEISTTGEGAIPSGAAALIGARRRRRKQILLAGLMIILAAFLALLVYYLITKKPITELPGVQALGRNVPPTYLFSIYDVSEPTGVAVSPDGQRIYVAESAGERQVRIFTRDGTQLLAFGPPDSQPGNRSPLYPAVSSDGRVYVPDLYWRGVLIYTPDGKFNGILRPNGDSAFKWAPLGINFGTDGTAYVTDRGESGDRVVVLEPSGMVKQTIGKKGNGDGELYQPQRAVVDRQKRVYVSDGVNSRVSVFLLDGKFKQSFGGGTAEGSVGIPRGMAVDDQNRLYVVNAVDHNVQVFGLDADNKFLFSFGAAGKGDGQFVYPNDIAVDSSARIYVADRKNNRVQVWGY